MTDSIDRQKKIRRVTLLGAVIDGILGFLKIQVGWLVHSPALVADGIHSLSDLVTDFGVLFFSHLAQDAPDADHPYGHYRYETLGTVILGTSLVVVASAIAWDSVLSLLNGIHTPKASWLAISIAIISIVSKEWIYRFTLKAAKTLNSKLLEANAWHSRSDALSSIVVLFGVIATWFGYPWVESLAAIIVAIFIGKIGVKLTWNASQDLVDRGMDVQSVNEIKKIISETPGVVDVHMLRSRMMGNHAYVDVHIQVGAIITVSEGHYIAEQVLQRVKGLHDDVSDITVHVDYEEDQHESVETVTLPCRAQFEQVLKQRGIEPDKLQIHYLSNKLQCELFFWQTPERIPSIRQKLDEWLAEEEWFESYELYQKIES